MGRNYKIDDEDKFTGLPGVNPALAEFHMQNNVDNSTVSNN